MPDLVSRLDTALKGRYRIERKLGQGGMATVYLAVDLRHEREVALKVLVPELVSAVGSTRFLREIRIAARLRHPPTPPLLDPGGADRFRYYTIPVARVITEFEPPGVRTVWIRAPRKPGKYLIQCTNYCCLGHAQMKAWLVVAGPSTGAKPAAKH